MRYLPLLFILLFCSDDLYSQEFKILEGQITTDSISPTAIHIVNLDLEKGTTSDYYGAFKIYANIGDRILFSSIQFENKEILVSAKMYNSGSLSVRLEPARNELDEIQISDLKLSGHLDTDLPKIKFFDRTKYGIPYPEKQLSQTERRLFTATTGKGGTKLNAFSVLSGMIPLAPIINGITGKTKYLKKLDQQDKLQVLVQRGIDVLGRSFFINTLKLPEPEIENFVYYCARKPEFKNVIQRNNPLDIIEFYKTHTKDFINLRELNESIEN